MPAKWTTFGSGQRVVPVLIWQGRFIATVERQRKQGREGNLGLGARTV